MQNKVVIVMNGSGGVGKDTLCEGVANRFPVKIVSSVDPIKKIATMGGWKGEKNDAGRLLLVRLKQAFVDYNDLPLQYLKEEYTSFLQGEEAVMFVHIREPHEIDKFKREVPCKTILVTRDGAKKWNNQVDSGVLNYTYDYTFPNDDGLDVSIEKFTNLIENILENKN